MVASVEALAARAARAPSGKRRFGLSSGDGYYRSCNIMGIDLGDRRLCKAAETFFN
jgi:hypothetical protein